MITVIVAGGSGTRLWPLSTPDFPKQLLKLTNEKSLVQNTYERAKRISGEVYIVPDISHAHHVKEQLPDLDDNHFVVEPGRRGTANCIIAALAHVSKRHGSSEPVAFISADHHIRDTDGFAHSFGIAAEVSASQGQIALVGIEPTYPATGFGYIERDGGVSGFTNVYQVQSFKEKPDFNTARKYMASGRYLWNCGYFVGSVDTFLSAMAEYAPELKERYDKLVAIKDVESDEYKDTYLSFESNTIDYALIEKAKGLAVVPAGFDWMDLGSFSDLHQANASDESGNYLKGEKIYTANLENAYVHNDEDKPVAVIGLDNVVVVNTKEGVLVARKDLSQKVGDIAKLIHADGDKK